MNFFNQRRSDLGDGIVQYFVEHYIESCVLHIGRMWKDMDGKSRWNEAKSLTLFDIGRGHDGLSKCF